MEKLGKAGDPTSQLGAALDDGKILSFSDFMLIDQVKDCLIVCAALLAARGRNRMTTAERDALNELREAVDRVFKVNED